MNSIFINKEIEPKTKDLKKGLGDTFDIWQELVEATTILYPKAIQKWHFSGDKYGWSFRISDSKRVIVYLLPRDKYFKSAFVFGQKATDEILKSSISEKIKKELSTAKVYAEGRGIRIDLKDRALLNDIKELIRIKISN